MRRAVLLVLANSPEGATTADIRRDLRSRGVEASAAEVAGACRHFAAAGLVWRTLTQHERNTTWAPSPALFTAATTLVPEEVER